MLDRELWTTTTNTTNIAGSTTTTVTTTANTDESVDLARPLLPTLFTLLIML